MKKLTIFGLVLLFCIGLVTATSPFITSSAITQGYTILYPNIDVFMEGEVAKLHFHVINTTTGKIINTSYINCSFHLYNSTDEYVLKIDVMTKDVNNHDLEQSINTTPTGRYYYNIWCFDSIAGGFVAGFYDVTPNGVLRLGNDGTLFSFLALIPFFLAIILLVGAVSLGEEHAALRIGLFLLSPVSLIVSLNIATSALAEFYNFPSLQDTIGSTVYWISLVWVVIITYFVIYLIYKAVHTAAQKKKERLEY